MIKRYLSKVIIFFILCYAAGISDFRPLYAQVVGPQEIKWIWVSSLRQWFSNGGAEIEYGRRSRTFLTTDQLDGMQWPAEYIYQDVNVGKCLWIGTTDFLDPIDGRVYPYKVAKAGRIFMYLNTEIFPQEFLLIGRFEHPMVLVDQLHASDLDINDQTDLIDPDMEADRMIYNTIHTSIGVSVTRKVRAFTQQYHDNYFINEYVFKNTGIIDNSGQQKLNKTLTGVIFHFQYRYGFAGESYREGWSPTGASWGLNTINDVVGQNAGRPLPAPNDFRACYEYYGPVSTAPSVNDDIGLPRYTNGSIMAGTKFAGVIVLHADASPQDPNDDPMQPFTTQFMGSDQDGQGVDQYDAALMAKSYSFMSAGHPVQTHAERIGKDPVTGWPTGFANNPVGLGDPGGYSSAQGFGPYTLNIGDSIRIVVAEAVDGLDKDRLLNKEITRKWFNNSGPFVLPDGNTTTDHNIYKNTWVFTGKDLLFQSFRRARANFNSGYQITQPPPPPNMFSVNSGGNQISLSWSNSAETWSTFNGYQLFRAEGKPDTTYEMIFSCNKNNVVNTYDDKAARRGFNYYYYIQTVDDGSTNTDTTFNPRGPLVSSRFYTQTNTQAYLTRPPGNRLSEIRVVPNPYNIRMKDLQFGQDTPDRLAFYGLPPYCTIKIYTETGDLIETIEHSNGSGDEYWHSLTSSRQLVVSGLYIAYFEVSKDTYDDSGKLIFKKGENIFRKFIIIR
jgi:hypothetical protein